MASYPFIKRMTEITECIYNEHHVLHTLLPDRNEHGYKLRLRRHERALTTTDDKRNFIYRQLHKDSY